MGTRVRASIERRGRRSIGVTNTVDGPTACVEQGMHDLHVANDDYIPMLEPNSIDSEGVKQEEDEPNYYSVPEEDIQSSLE